MPDRPPDSLSPAEAHFADWIALRESEGAAPEFEALCRAHPEEEAELRRLWSYWNGLRSVFDRVGLVSGPRSLADKIQDRFGSGVDPDVALDVPEGAEPPSDALLRRLADHTLKSSRYKLHGEIARGGMGAILKVFDEDLRRNLAMKVILGKAEQTSTGGTPPVDKRLLARFLEEAQITGQLDHPGIVPVHELGLDSEGRVYFTMKLVKGRDLKQIFDLVFSDQEGWSETRALGVILKVCEAMAYAHKKGVIHRDLKPANVMVGNFGEVYVMDWGLARVEGREDRHDLRLQVEGTPLSSLATERREEREGAPDSPLFTMDGDIVGTPAYMSPEQARGEVSRLTARSDVYSVGAMLYHLLTRQMPYCPPDARVTNRTVLGLLLHGAPASIESLRKGVPAPLVAICERALARESERRYADTAALARDLAAFLENRVVSAYRTGPWQELRTWVHRNRALFATGVTAAVALVVLLLGVIWQIDKDRRRVDREILADQRARYADNLDGLREALESRSIELAWTRLEQCPESLRGWEWGHGALMAGELLHENVPSTGDVKVSWSPNGRWIAATVGGYAVSLVDPDGEGVRGLVHDGWVANPVWSPDGERIATYCTGDDRKIRIWEVATGELALSMNAVSDVEDVSWSSNGRLLASWSDYTLQVWEATSGAELARFESVDERPSWCPRGEVLAYLDDDQTIHLWSADDGEFQTILDTSSSFLSWSPNASLLTWQKDGIEAWDIEKRSRIRLLDYKKTGTEEPAWSPDGAWFVWTGPGWPVVGSHAREVSGFTVDEDCDSSVVWSPRGSFAFADDERIVVVHAPTHATTVLYGHLGNVEKLAWSHDGERLATLAADHTLRISDPQSAAAPHVLETAESWPLDFSWSGGDLRIAAVSEGGVISVWDAATGRGLKQWSSVELEESTSEEIRSSRSSKWLWGWATERGGPYEDLDDPGYVLGVQWTSSGALAVCGDSDDDDRPVMRVGRDGPVHAGHQSDVTCVSVHRDGRLLSGSEDGTARIWSAGDSRELRGHAEAIRFVAWAPSGGVVATGSDDATIRTWDVATGSPLKVLVGHRGRVRGLAWRTDSRILASAGEDATVLLWDCDSGTLQRTLDSHTAPVTSVAWDSSGNLLASASEDGSIRLWRAPNFEPAGTLLGHTSGVSAVAWHPVGARLVSVGYDNALILWDVDAGKLFSRKVWPDIQRTNENGEYLLPQQVKLDPDSGLGVEFSPDGKRLAVWANNLDSFVFDSDINQAVGRWQSELSDDRLEEHSEWEGERPQAIERLVAALLEEEVLPDRVLERLETYPALTDDERQLARKRAGGLSDPDPADLNARAWALAHPLSSPDSQSIDKSLKLATAARDLAPENASIRDTLAWALFANGNREDALKEMARAIALATPEERPAYEANLELIQTKRGPLDRGELVSRHARLATLKYGSDKMVESGLNWLAAHQAPDGSWDCDGFGALCPDKNATCGGPGGAAYDVGVTGLALAAFLPVGHGFEGALHHGAVLRAIEALIAQQDLDTGLIGRREVADFIYNHAIATWALCEAYARTRSARLEEPCRNAVRFILRSRNPYGAWRYDFPPVGDNDVSVTGWMILALIAAMDSGLMEDPEAVEIRSAFDGTLSFVDEVTDPASGRVGYSAFGESSMRYATNKHFPQEKGEATTAEGLLIRLLLGQRAAWTPVIDKQARRVLSRPPVWDVDGFSCDMYYWFFGSDAMYQMGGQYWQAWSRALNAVLKAGMRKDGHFAGSWDPIDAWSFKGGRVYSTAMMVLCAGTPFGRPRGR